MENKAGSLSKTELSTPLQPVPDADHREHVSDLAKQLPDQSGLLPGPSLLASPDDLGTPQKKVGIFARMMGAVKEWRFLQTHIRVLAATVAKNEFDVLEGINNYRLTLTGVPFKPVKVDQEIWELYQKIRLENPVLVKRTLKAPLNLRGRKRLREFHQAWEELSNQQNTLLDLLTKAPASVEFYNRVHLAQIKKREQEEKDAEFAEKTARARDAIEKALARIGQMADGSNAVSGSSILRLEDAKKHWQQRLLEISSLESSSKMNSEEVIHIFRNMEEMIADAPGMAERVKEVEVMFIRLMSMNEELSGFGKSVIPAEDLARTLLIVQDEIPKLWATGSWDKLNRCLNDVISFVKFYDLPVRSELSIAERRKPGFTKAVLNTANSLPLNQVTPLIRSLVSAIDARDHYMRGHSDMVSQLVTKVAQKMNWTTEDVELLEVAALLHDVGKIMIPESVLTKVEPLTSDEWKTIQMHPYHGARIAKPLTALSKIIPWIYHHQERWDGTGYPDRLGKTAIPAAARLISVAEAYTVMTIDQPKREAYSMDQALNEIKDASGTQFDPEIAEAFSEVVASEADKEKM